MREKAAIILAAGQGKRMKSRRPKVLHLLAGMPMLDYTLNLVERLHFQKVYVIVGYQADQVKAVLSGRDITALLQHIPLGTGDAVLKAKQVLENFPGPVLILSGDTPLLREETVRGLCERHEAEKATITLLTTRMPVPDGYGRVIRGKGGEIIRVVEEKDATPDQRSVQEVNCGVYVAEAAFLFEALAKVAPNNQQQEYYLTDIIQIAADASMKLVGWEAAAEEVVGINSRADMAMAEEILQRRINTRWMAEGVTFIDPSLIRIGARVTIGRDTILYPGVTLEGETDIGEGCVLHPCRIRDSHVGSDVVIKDHCVIEGANIESMASVGPFAHLRSGTLIRQGAKVGNFVEIKKSELGEGSKANHLSYIGDTVVGKGVNIGAGTITCNYDGEKKHQTIIEDNVFIGSDTQLVAPVRVGARSLIAAGSTITQDVPPDTLAISRVKQENKIGWVERRKIKRRCAD